jgi:Mg-chelatase subunit ChlD
MSRPFGLSPQCRRSHALAIVAVNVLIGSGLAAEPGSPPTTQNAKPRSVVLIIDGTGSMVGTRLDLAKKLVADELQSLTKDDRFAVVLYFNGEKHELTAPKTPSLQPANEANKKGAQKTIDVFFGKGSGDPLDAFAWVARSKATECILFSDGDFNLKTDQDAESFLKKAAEIAGKGKLSIDATFIDAGEDATGATSGLPLLKKLAEQNHGSLRIRKTNE